MITNSKFKYSNGDKYQGDHDPTDGYKHGEGEMKYANDDKYKGRWWNNLKHKGKMEYVNGEVFDGTWIEKGDNGIRTGTLTKDNG